jgi:prophage tail gpP-like protein
MNVVQVAGSAAGFLSAPPAPPVRDEVTLIVASRRISGWTDVRVTRGIERCPNDFDIGLTDLYPDALSQLVVQPGDPCKLLIGNDPVITGYIDRMEIGLSADQHAIRISGRGKTQDLVDCSAEWPTGQISGADALGIAKKLAAPYGIEVEAADPDEIGEVVPQFNMIIGETPFSIIERVCRYRALLAYEQPDGSLLLSRTGVSRAGSGFTEGQNVQACSMMACADQRFSEYRVFLQSMDALSDLGTGGNLIYTATDEGMARHRIKMMIAEAGGQGLDIAKQRALWEAARRAGRSAIVSVTTDTWRDAAGWLWTPNTLVRMALPSLKLADETWLVGEVTYSRNNESGTTATVALAPPAAFEPEPINFAPFHADVPAGVAALGPGDPPR